MFKLFFPHSISIADNADNINNKYHLQITQIGQYFNTGGFICLSVRGRILHTGSIGVSISDNADNTKLFFPYSTECVTWYRKSIFST